MSAAMRGSSSTTRTFISRFVPLSIRVAAPASTSTILPSSVGRDDLETINPSFVRADEVDRDHLARGVPLPTTRQDIGERVDLALFVKVAGEIVIVIAVVLRMNRHGRRQRKPGDTRNS